MKNHVYGLLVLACFLIGCGQKGPKEVTRSGIVNGTQVTKADDVFNSTALLLSSRFMCSGVLISKKTILTAAHCFDEGPLEAVYLGEYSKKWGTNPNKYQIKSYVVHEEYDRKDFSNDIALVFLKNEVKAPFHPIKILDNEKLVTASAPFVLAGFSSLRVAGKTDFYDILTDKEIKWDRTELKPELYKKTVIGQEIGPGPSPKMGLIQFTGGLCPGDSGGPTMMKIHGEHYLVAINNAVVQSHGTFDCENIAYSTMVRGHLPWINQKLALEKTSAAIEKTEEVSDIKERECAESIVTNINAQFSLLGLKTNCEGEAQKTVVNALIQDCFNKCTGLEDFKGQCEFMERGRPKLMLDYETACSSFH